MEVRRGDIWWADLGEPRGSGPGDRRPVLVVQSDSFNRSRLATTIVAVITANLRLVEAPGNVALPSRLTGLPRDSVANIAALYTVDRGILLERVGRLSPGLMEQVENGLRIVLAV